MKAASFEVISNAVSSAQRLLRQRLGQRGCPSEIFGYEKERCQLKELLMRTVTLGESNSLLLIGPRGSGKTMLINSVLEEIRRNSDAVNNFIEVHLSGLLLKDDKVSLKEITRQLKLENVVGERVFGSFAENLQFLLDSLKSGDKQSMSVLFILDEFDLFSQHRNQTLLYNLFDVAQSAQAPICVVGVTVRMDVLELLEKRVKSRFSHRQIHLSPGYSFDGYVSLFQSYLRLPEDAEIPSEFIQSWNMRVKSFSDEPAVVDLLKQQYNIDRDVRLLQSFMLVPVCRVTTDRPLLEASDFINSYKLLHATDSKAAMLHGLSILELCLVIAMKHLTELFSNEPINFEMVYNEYHKFCKHRSAIQLFDKMIVMKAFEHLSALELVRPLTESSGASQRAPPEFRLMSLMVDPSEIMDALQKYPSCPTDIRQWAIKEVINQRDQRGAHDGATESMCKRTLYTIDRNVHGFRQSVSSRAPESQTDLGSMRDVIRRP